MNGQPGWTWVCWGVLESEVAGGGATGDLGQKCVWEIFHANPQLMHYTVQGSTAFGLTPYLYACEYEMLQYRSTS